MSREIKFSFIWQHMETGRIIDKVYTLDQIIAGDHYDDFSDNAFLKRYTHVTTRQWTGLYDCDGVEIYEGDFICDPNYPEESVCSVDFEEGAFFANSVDEPEDGSNALLSEFAPACMVISQTHEHHDLCGHPVVGVDPGDTVDLLRERIEQLERELKQAFWFAFENAADSTVNIQKVWEQYQALQEESE